jgi:ankyrin repeat protein
VAYGRRNIPEDTEQLLELITTGRLFAVQEWIKAGKRLRLEEADDTALRTAITTGFHSMVEELLKAGGWDPQVLAEALEFARSRKRYDIAELLMSHGAKPEEVDFQTCCEQLDVVLMERHLRAGTDPNQDNAFARALCSVKARPLLGFYRQFNAEFPALQDQAALALSEAVKSKQVRWTALLAWAGADPFRPVPSDLEMSFPVDPEDCTTAAKEALWRNHLEILKVLHLKPNPQQALDLLDDAAYANNLQLFKTLLAAAPREELNKTPRNSSSVLEKLVARWGHRDLFTRERGDKGDDENLKCIELLLDAGARWNPPTEDLRHCRRHLMEHNPRYIVQVARLLLYTPNAADREQFLELCRSQTLEAKITGADMPLVQEIRSLRKGRSAINNPGRNSGTDQANEGAPAQAASAPP